MAKRIRYSKEVRERAVRLLKESLNSHTSEWAATQSVASKIGCSAETLRKWSRQSDVDTGRVGGLTTEERERIKALERENRELKQANEILRKAAAFFAQAELGRKLK